MRKTKKKEIKYEHTISSFIDFIWIHLDIHRVSLVSLWNFNYFICFDKTRVEREVNVILFPIPH